MDEINNTNEHNQTPSSLTTNTIPSLMSLPVESSIPTKNIQDKSTAPISVIKEK